LKNKINEEKDKKKKTNQKNGIKIENQTKLNQTPKDMIKKIMKMIKKNSNRKNKDQIG
jgi:ribosomal protein L13E